MRKIFFIILLLLLVSTSLVSASAAVPITGDGVCRNDLGEDRVNSPDDCKPDAGDYLGCYMSKDSCIDSKTWNEVVLGLAGVIAVLALLLFNKDGGK